MKHKSLYRNEDWYVEPVNAESIDWWEENVETHDPALVEHAEQKQSSNTWIFWIILLLGLQVIRFCTDGTGSSTNVGEMYDTPAAKLAYIKEINKLSDKIMATKGGKNILAKNAPKLLELFRLRQELKNPSLGRKEKALKLKELNKLQSWLYTRRKNKTTGVSTDKQRSLKTDN